MNIKNIIYISFIALLSISCAGKRNWESVHVLYSDGNEKNMFVSPADASYYAFIYAKEDKNAEVEYLNPEEVQEVVNDKIKYVSLFFDKENYGMESYSFGERLGGDTIMLVKTKFREKTCACKTSGAYFNGFFIVYGRDFLRVRTNRKKEISNRTEVYDFFEKHSETGLPENIYTINDILSFLKQMD